MNNYKFIAFDLDGSLLNDDLEISKYTYDNLIVLNKKFICAVSSSRCLKNIKSVIKDINFNYIISSNGALIFNNINNKIIKYDLINSEIVYQIINFLKQYDLIFNIFTLNKVFYNKICKLNINKKYQLSLNPQDIKIINDKDFENVISIEIIIENEKNVKKVIKDLIKKYNIYINLFKSGNNYVEITKKGIDKGFSLEYISRQLMIEKKFIIAVGDSETDIPMFDFAGLKIAMKNGCKDILKKSDILTDFDNNDDGAIKFIVKILDLK